MGYVLGMFSLFLTWCFPVTGTLWLIEPLLPIVLCSY